MPGRRPCDLVLTKHSAPLGTSTQGKPATESVPLGPTDFSPHVCFSLGSGVTDFRRFRWLPSAALPRAGLLLHV